MEGPLLYNCVWEQGLVQICCRLIVELIGTLSCMSMCREGNRYLFLILIHVITLTVCLLRLELVYGVGMKPLIIA